MAEEEVTLAVLGDSLTDGFEVAPGESFAEQLGVMLRELGRRVRVRRAGVCGDTSGGALRRLPGLLAEKPELLLIAIGVNDFYSGVSAARLEGNLRALIARGREGGARVLLAEMRFDGRGWEEDGYGDAYARAAADLGVPLLLFPLDEVAATPGLVLPDGVHPTAGGHRYLAEVLLPQIGRILEERAC